jgi:hypothetical protein
LVRQGHGVSHSQNAPRSIDAQLSVLEEKLQVALADPDNDVSTIRAEYHQKLSEVEHRSRRLDFAGSIDAMNYSISGLNVVLVIAAAVAGFNRQRVIVSTQQKVAHLAGLTPPEPESEVVSHVEETVPADDPEKAMAERLRALRTSLAQRRDEMADGLRAADRAISRARQLADSDPVREWRGIANRLRCAIPMFRNENARLRHLDPRDIRAFSRPVDISFDPPVFECRPSLRNQIDESAAKLEALSAECEQLGTGVRRSGLHSDPAVSSTSTATIVATERDYPSKELGEAVPCTVVV